MNIITQCNLAQLVVDLLDGKTVVFPTETSYGLGCDATNQAAADAIYKIKGRTPDKPLLVVVPDVAMAKKYLVWNETLEMLSQKYWPGPLTIVGEVNPLSGSLCCDEEKNNDHTPCAAAEGAGGGYRSFSFESILGSIKTLGFRREMRKNPTKAEKILWSNLRAKRLGGIKFHRQHGIGPYIVDFFQSESKVVVEVDGDIHFIEDENITKDKNREVWLKKNGYTVLRYNNVDIFNNLENILEEILRAVTDRHSSPCPLRCDGGGLASGVVSKDGTVAVRVTANPLLISITQKLGRPLVATSANLSDTGDMYDSSVILDQFQGREFQPDIVLNQGVLPRNPPSTIVSVVNNELKILRQGAIEIKNIK